MARATAHDKVRRDAAIVADRARGLQWRTVADRYGLSERQCRAIWTEAQAVRRTDHVQDAEAIVHDVIASLDALVEDLALLSEGTSNDSVRLGAIKARMQAVEQRFGVMRAAGLLPPTWEALRVDLDGRKVAQRIFDVFEAHGVDEVVKDDVLAAVETISPPQSDASLNGAGG